MSIVKPPFKKLEFKRKYAYLHRNDGIILRHPIRKIEVTLDFFNCLHSEITELTRVSK